MTRFATPFVRELPRMLEADTHWLAEDHVASFSAVERERADALYPKPCPDCLGTGLQEMAPLKPWDAPRYESCDLCGGSGVVERSVFDNDSAAAGGQGVG